MKFLKAHSFVHVNVED